MKECPLQIRDKCPACGHKFLHLIEMVSDASMLSEFKLFQILKAKLYGVLKPRSVIQLHLYWALCGVVAGNLEDMTKEDVDFEVKVKLKHIKSFKVIKGATYIEVDSIAFRNLPHLEACNFFDRAFSVMAKMINVTLDELMANAG